jgi:hypothetical protein
MELEDVRSPWRKLDFIPCEKKESTDEHDVFMSQFSHYRLYLALFYEPMISVSAYDTGAVLIYGMLRGQTDKHLTRKTAY